MATGVAQSLSLFQPFSCFVFGSSFAYLEGMKTLVKRLLLIASFAIVWIPTHSAQAGRGAQRQSTAQRAFNALNGTKKKPSVLKLRSQAYEYARKGEKKKAKQKWLNLMGRLELAADLMAQHIEQTGTSDSATTARAKKLRDRANHYRKLKDAIKQDKSFEVKALKKATRKPKEPKKETKTEQPGTALMVIGSGLESKPETKSTETEWSTFPKFLEQAVAKIDSGKGLIATRKTLSASDQMKWSRIMFKEAGILEILSNAYRAKGETDKANEYKTRSETIYQLAKVVRRDGIEAVRKDYAEKNEGKKLDDAFVSSGEVTLTRELLVKEQATKTEKKTETEGTTDKKAERQSETDNRRRETGNETGQTDRTGKESNPSGIGSKNYNLVQAEHLAEHSRELMKKALDGSNPKLYVEALEAERWSIHYRIQATKQEMARADEGLKEQYKTSIQSLRAQLTANGQGLLGPAAEHGNGKPMATNWETLMKNSPVEAIGAFLQNQLEPHVVKAEDLQAGLERAQQSNNEFEIKTHQAQLAATDVYIKRKTAKAMRTALPYVPQGEERAALQAESAELRTEARRILRETVRPLVEELRNQQAESVDQ
jgi:hypothetical protein